MYNLNVASSDNDYMGVFAFDTDKILGHVDCRCMLVRLVAVNAHGSIDLDTFEETVGNQGRSLEVEHRCYEARLFCESLLKGNPSVIGIHVTCEVVPLCANMLCFTELLYHTDPSFESEIWHELVEHRDLFISEMVLRQYLGFIRVQLN